MSTDTDPKGFSVKLIHAEDERAIELVVTHDGKEIRRECDMMEPEDATFGRDLAWIPDAIQQAYRLGRDDMAAELIRSFTAMKAKGPESLKGEPTA